MNCHNSSMNESQELEYKTKNSIIQDKFRRGCDAIKEHGHLAMKSLFSNLDQRVGCWVEDARCRHSISSIFHVKKEAKAYTEELVGICQRKIKDATSTWVSDTFVPLMANEIYSLASSLGAEVQDYSQGLGTIRVDASVDRSAIVKSTTPSNGNKAASVGLSLLVGGLPGAIMGGFGGFDALMKTLGCEVVAAITLVVISMFTPVGLLGIAIGIVASCIAGGNMALNSIEKKIKEKVVESLRGTLKSDMILRNCSEKVDATLDSYFNELRTALEI